MGKKEKVKIIFIFFKLFQKSLTTLRINFEIFPTLYCQKDAIQGRRNSKSS
jgi:hypothetical protein